MTESIAEALTSLTGNDYLTLFLLSAIPLTELRGALIIMGGMPEVNRALGTLCCIAGSAAIVLPVILLVRPVINRLKENERLAAGGGGEEGRGGEGGKRRGGGGREGEGKERERKEEERRKRKRGRREREKRGEKRAGVPLF